MGPMLKLSIPDTLEVSQDETLILFTTRTLVDEGFTGVNVKNRNWVTYLNPPFLYCILLTQAENQHDFEQPMIDVLESYQPNDIIGEGELGRIYDDIVSLIGVSLKSRINEKVEVRDLLAFIRQSPEPLRSSWSEKHGYHFPSAEEITNLSGEETNILLSTMMTAELLHGRICGNIAICPRCSSHRIVMHASCPKCGLPTLETGIAMEHFVCEHTAFIEKFSTASGLVCPQCRTALTTGTYRSLGKIFHCVTCNSYPDIPDHMFGCLQCKETFLTKQAKYRPVYSYTSSD